MTRDPDHILNWQRLDPLITTSGQPSEEQIAELAMIGVQHVINLGLHSHPRALPDEEASVRQAGMRYTHIPVPFDAPDEGHYAAFREALDAWPGAVHVHCIMNFRVSAFFYRWHVEERGMDLAAARALMEQQWSPDAPPSEEQRAAFAAWAAFVAGTRGAAAD